MMFCSSSALGCLIANSEMTFSGSNAMYLCTDISINPVSHSFPMVDLRWFYTNFSVLFERSDEQVVTGRSQGILISVHTFGNMWLLACARAVEGVLWRLLEPATSRSAFHLTLLGFIWSEADKSSWHETQSLDSLDLMSGKPGVEMTENIVK